MSQPGTLGNRLRDKKTLHLLRLPHVIRHANVFALLFREAHQENDKDGNRHRRKINLPSTKLLKTPETARS